MTNLKDYRDRELPLFIIANVLVFLIVHKFINIDISDVPGTTKVFSEIFSSAVLAVAAFGFILVTECLFTSLFKEKLLYLFGFFGLLNLPGNTIFSQIKEKNPDKRFSFQTIKDKYPKLYENMPENGGTRLRYENERWYSIYSQCRDVSVIHNSQRDWLLCRDIYISALLMIVMYVIISILHFVEFNKMYLVFLVVTLIITNIGANRKAVRFAYNVIAYDLNKPPK